MSTKPNIGYNTLAPLLVQQYERYLPSAFDDSLSLLEKVNKVIVYLNQIGELSNNVLDEWNNVMDWVMADGLDGAIDAKIDSMVTDGTLDSIINESIFATLNASVTANTTAITANTASIATINTTLTNRKYYGTPEEYGAKGDGVTDDTTAIQACLNACKITGFKPVSYKITKTLVLPENNSIEGNHAELLITDTWTATNNGVSVPQNTILFVKGRQPIFLNELDMDTRFVRNLRIRGTNTFSLTGMYLGTTDKTQITQSSCVNYAVYGCKFENINISYCVNGLQLAEVWNCNFNSVKTSYITTTACLISGQIVNNTFTGCSFGTGSSGINGLYIDGDTYNGELRRPEGCTFLGGFIGQSQIGIRAERGLAFKFIGVVVDLNTVYAVTGTDMSDFGFSDTWLYCDGGTVFSIAPMSTTTNGTFVTFKGCNFVPTGDNRSAYINVRQNGIIFDACQLRNEVYFDDGASGMVMNCVWGETTHVGSRITDAGTGVVKASNNTFKYDGSPVPTSGIV
jgi:hypothetical protein